MTYANRKEMKAILSDAHDLIEDEESWCQGHFAKTGQNGVLCAPEGDDAECWCAVGAIQRAGLRRGADLDTIKAAALLLQANIGHMSITKFNDNHTHAEVLARFEQTLEKL